jgi:hypothetical protein
MGSNMEKTNEKDILKEIKERNSSGISININLNLEKR